MQRRTFIKDAAFGAIAVTASGFVSFDGTKYIGDCETTTDILGPFYRPGSPVRNNMLVAGDAGIKVLLDVRIKHNDCVTPLKNAKVEIWHCSPTGEYDNSTDEFRYRATAFTDNEGKYYFNTILPIPYEAGRNNFRPAHFHLMITAENYQPLITQIYFAGDKHLSTDSSSSSPTAKRRILNIQTLSDKSKKVSFDMSLSEKLTAEVSAIDRLAGTYQFEHDNSEVQFIKNSNTLWLKKDAFAFNMEYIGDNSFREISVRRSGDVYKFSPLADGKVKMELTSSQKVSIAYKRL